MRRREFIAGVCGVITLPVVARAQQPAKLPTIGFLGAGTASSQGQWFAAFVQRLRELGWIEGAACWPTMRIGILQYVIDVDDPALKHCPTCRRWRP
jgi:hypothetical protein